MTSRFRKLSLVSASFLALATIPAWAQELAANDAINLGTVTVTTSRGTETKVDKAPGTVSVITSEQIEDQLVTDIKDLVRYEPGVSVRRSPARFGAALATTGRDNNSGFNIRGMEGNRVLIMVDGVRVPDSYSFGAQNVGRGDYVDVGVLKSVEIVRGPSSAMYGSDGLAGSVQFITKDPSDILSAGNPFAARGSAGYDSASDSFSESVLLAGSASEWEGMVAYTRRDGHALDNMGTNNSADANRTTPNPEDNQSNAILGKIVFSPDESNRFRLTLDHLDRHVDWNVLSGVSVTPPALTATSVVGLTAFDNLKRDRISLDHRYEGTGFISAAHTTGYYQSSKTRQYSFEDRVGVDRTRDSTFDTRVYGVMAELTSVFDTGPLAHRIVYGVDYSNTEQGSIRDGTVPSPGDTFPTRAFPNSDYTLLGLFIEDRITLGPVTVYPALRWDYYDLSPQANDPLYPTATLGVPTASSDSHLSPKVGIVWEAHDHVTVFANYALGFKAPGPMQVNNGFTNATSFYKSISNPNLKPETSETIEGGVRLHDDGVWSAGITGFHGAYSDFITQQQVGGTFTALNPAIYQYVNLTDVEISGFEARGKWFFAEGFNAQMGLSWTEGSSSSAGVTTPLSTIDPLKFVAGLGYRDPEGVFGGEVMLTHVGLKDPADAGVTCTPSCFIPSDFTIVDATAYWNATENFTIRAGIFNLFDEKYWYWADVRGQASNSTTLDAYTQPGRNFSVSLSVKL